jgi:hypothetical protein
MHLRFVLVAILTLSVVASLLWLVDHAGEVATIWHR